VISEGSNVTDSIQKVCKLATEELKSRCEVKNVAMDGNCMFSSLALQLSSSHRRSPDEIRQEVVDYVQSHSHMVSVVFTKIAFYYNEAYFL